MTRPKTELPKLRRHRAKNQAYFRFRNRQHYCGTWGTSDAKTTFRRKLTEIVLPALGLDGMGPPEAPTTLPSALLIEDLAADYIQYVERRYAPPSKEPQSIWYAVKALLDLYGNVRITEFRPRSLQAVRNTLVRSGLTRTTVNRRLYYIRRMFQWGVGQEMVPSTVSHALGSVESLRAGELGVREGEPVQSATIEQVQAILPHLSKQVVAMVCVQWLTGMRPGEVCIMRKADLHDHGGHWYYRPQQHKNLHRGKDREVEILPEVMSFLTPFLLRPPDAYLFDPREADAEFRAEKGRRRRSKTPPSQQARHERARRNSRSLIGPRYTTASYGRAIKRACKRAQLTASGNAFTPHMIRHAATTLAAVEAGMIQASKAMGHATIKTTERYTHPERGVARPAFEALAKGAQSLRAALQTAGVPSGGSPVGDNRADQESAQR
tara:strand:- start:3663 stop:4973 length:1311 start_codon:yes stop_codon:yes gene_type:complete